MSTTKWAWRDSAVGELERVYDTLDKVAAGSLQKMADGGDYGEDDDELETKHHLLEMMGNLAILTVRGTLIEGSAGWWGRYYDIVGYDDIRNAVTCAVNAGAKAILVNLMSPGGMVIGLGALNDYLKKVDSIVPITFFCEAYAASGGVWMASTTGKFYASRHAEVGSVGVIAVTAEYTEWDKEMGIKRRVFKSTPLKASGNHNEKLDDANAAEIQRGVDESAQRFIDHIAQGMGLTSDYVANSIANGKVWYADEAVRLGLVSGITTYDELLVDLQQKVSQNTNSSPSGQPVYFQQHAEADMAKRKTLKVSSAEEALALAASGVVSIASDDVENEGEMPDDEESPVEEQNDDEEENVTEKTEASTSDTFSKLIADNVAQLTEAKVSLGMVNAKLASAEAKIASLEAVEAQFKQVVAKKIQWAFAAAGSAIPDEAALLAMSSESLLAQNASAEAMVAKRYGNGGQHAVIVDEDEDAETKRANAAAQAAKDVLAPLSRFLSDDQ